MIVKHDYHFAIIGESLSEPHTSISHSFVAVNTAKKTPTLHEIITCHNFSSLNRLLRVTTYVLRFLNKLKKRNTNTNSTCTDQSFSIVPSAAEINLAELC